MQLKALVLAGIAAVFVAAFFVAGSRHHGASSNPPSVLFSQSADSGTLMPARGGRMTLTLRGVAPQLVWFQDRPDRDAGHLRTDNLVPDWGKLGFASDPPNAVLTLLDGADGADTIAVELLHRPRYNPTGQTVVYDVRQLREASNGLHGFQDDLDSRVPERFDTASLFIDNADPAHVHALDEARPDAAPASTGRSIRGYAPPTGAPQQPAAASPGPAPGWYADPNGVARLRYFDGLNWTDQTAN